MVTQKDISKLESFACEAYKIFVDELSVVFRSKKDNPLLIDFYGFFYIECALLFFQYNKIEVEEVAESPFLNEDTRQKKDFAKLYKEAQEIEIDNKVLFSLGNLSMKLTEISSKLSNKSYFYAFNLSAYEPKIVECLEKYKM